MPDLRPVAGYGVERPPRPRGTADVERRPSMPPRCTKRRAEPAVSRVCRLVPSFGVVCVLTYVLLVASMIAAGLTRT